MTPRALAAVTAAVALAAFAATLLLASDTPRPGSALAAFGGDEGGEAAAGRPDRPDRPAPQPDVTIPTPPEATGGTGTRDGRRLSLADAPREVILYARGCTEWYATEPWQDGRRFRADGLGRTCAVEWTPQGELVSVERGDAGDSVLVRGRSGTARRLTLTGMRIQGQPAAAEEAIVACGRVGGRTALFRWSAGASTPRRWHEGCLPALARDGSLAFARTPPYRRAGDPATVLVQRPGADPRTVASWQAATVRSVAWSGDGRRVIAVVAQAGRVRAISIGLDGAPDHVLATLDRGELVAHPSPAGPRVLLVLAPAAGAASIEASDADGRGSAWSSPVDDAADVAWSPSGSRLLIVDRRRWSFVEPGTGVERLGMERLGDAPAWCCPQGAG